jgi:hypothetical protein
MTITSLFIILNVILAVFAVGQVVQRPDRKARGVGARSHDHRIDARVRVAEIGPRSVAAQTRIAVCVAPLDVPGTAIELTDLGHGDPVRIGVDQVQSLRVWLRGRPVPVVSGDMIESLNACRPLSHKIAGWELELTTRDGDLVRCYGAELGADTEQDLARLRRMLAVRVRTEADVRRPAVVAVRSLGAQKWQPIAL